jgi:hypothetical protein
MFRYFGKLYDDAKIYTYNYFHQDQATVSTKTYQTLQSEDNDKIDCLSNSVDDKQLRIDILLFVRQFKNTYYKYSNKYKFNPELYNSFVDDKHFDGGLTAFDDDDCNIRIFDKYILEYIKNRNDVMTYLQCKNINIELQTKLDDLKDIKCSNNENIDVIFTIDMNEKDLFNYCNSIINKNGNISMIKNIVFSIIIKYNGEYIRIKLGAFNKNKNNHPYLILERFIS